MPAILPEYRSVFQTTDDVQQNVSHTPPYSEAEVSTARIGPGRQSLNAVSCLQPLHSG